MYIAEGKLPMGKALKTLTEQEQIKREYRSIQQELERKLKGCPPELMLGIPLSQIPSSRNPYYSGFPGFH